MFTFVDLFAGIGGMRIALESAGGKCVFSSEINKFAVKTYEENFGETPHGDITKIDTNEIPDHNVLAAGFPCQPFSLAGLKKGFNDSRGTLFFEIERIVRAKKPDIVLLENIKNFAKHDDGNTFNVVKSIFEDIGYSVSYEILNASDFGLPQNRERIFIVCINKDALETSDFKFPNPPKTKTRLGDILEKNVDSKYRKSDKAMEGLKRRAEKYKNQKKRSGFIYRVFNEDSERSHCLTHRYEKDGKEILIETDGNPRMITPREAARLQGFPETFKIPVSRNQAYRQFGNSVAVPVVAAIAIEIARLLNENDKSVIK